MDENKNEKLSDFAINATGGAIGAAIGAIGGPVGAITGSVIGEAATAVLSWAREEFAHKVLSTSEKKKVSRVILLTSEFIEENIKKGKILRDDDFFTNTIDSRSSAEETFEGIMLATQRENEEKKIPYYAKLYANIACNKEMNRTQTIQLIRASSELSYRQLSIIQTIAIFQMAKNNFGTLQGETLRKNALKTISGYSTISVLTDVLHLYHNGILQSSTYIFDIPSIIPDHLSIVGIGVKLYEYMELQTIPLDTEVVSALFEKK